VENGRFGARFFFAPPAAVESALRPAMSHPDIDKLLQFYRGARSQLPETFRRGEGVVPQPSFFSVQRLQQHLSNPVIAPNFVSLVHQGQLIPLEKSCFFKTVQQRQLWFMDKRLLDEHLRKGASVILEGLDMLDPQINEVCAQLDAGLPCSLVNCVAFFSQRGNELYRGHIDTDDVLVIHLSGEKRWRLYAQQAPRKVNLNELTPAQMGKQIAEITMRPGDALYVRSGIPHICETTGSHSLHLSFDLIDRIPNAEEIWRTAYARYELASLAPYTAAPEVAKRLGAELQSNELAAALAKRTEALRGEARAFRERIGSTRVRALDKFVEAQPAEKQRA
jgi:ribosomal protein L16 Arg81 hydroxylase